ncbi:MAG: hypothetical protein ACPGJS_08835 [Flammeovirgaceae bacterium]
MEQLPDDFDEKFLNYLEGDLSANDSHEFEKELFGDGDAHKRLEEYRTVMEGMESAPIYQPNSDVTENFFQRLQKEKALQEKNPLKKIRRLWGGNWWLQVAAAAILFVVGYSIDKQVSVEELRNEEITALREEIANTKYMVMLSMLNQQSASKRLQAVNYSYDLPNADEKLVEALLHTMNYDQNVNVRMAATEALFRFSSQEVIRMAMIQSLKKQESPEMQIMLIDMLASLKEEKALGVFKELANQEELMGIVKAKASEGIEVLL